MLNYIFTSQNEDVNFWIEVVLEQQTSSLLRKVKASKYLQCRGMLSQALDKIVVSWIQGHD
jgi:hypothetical protein